MCETCVTIEWTAYEDDRKTGVAWDAKAVAVEQRMRAAWLG